MKGGTRKVIVRSVTVYSRKKSSQCNLPGQIEQVQDKLENQLQQMNISRNFYLLVSLILLSIVSV